MDDQLQATVNEFKEKYFSNVIGPHIEAMKKLDRDQSHACKEHEGVLKSIQAVTDMYGNGDFEKAITKLIQANTSFAT